MINRNNFALLAAYLVTMPVAAFDGHNGIRFDMTQKQVEAMGFVCNPPEEKEARIRAECEHMEMTGTAFGRPTKDYSLVIGPSGKVDKIGAEFAGRISTADYLDLQSKIQHFFPIEYKPGSAHAQGVLIRDVWLDKTNASAILLLLFAVPPIRDTSLSISFWSPRSNANLDK